MKSEFYVDIEDHYSVNIYKTDGTSWWILAGWSNGNLLFTKCKKPVVKLEQLKNIPTLINKIPPTNKQNWNIVK